jgi:L-cysteine/cystine lyase
MRLAARLAALLAASGRRVVGREGAAAGHEDASSAAPEGAEATDREGAESAGPERGETAFAEGSTLVTFESPHPERERAELEEASVILRDIPGRPWLRASVGAWNDEQDLQRLLAALQA